MGLDKHLSDKAIVLRRETGKMMDLVAPDLLPHLEATTFPTFIIDKIREVGFNGLSLKIEGSPKLSTVETGAIAYELTKRDASVTTFIIVHNLVGMASIEKFGDEE